VGSFALPVVEAWIRVGRGAGEMARARLLDDPPDRFAESYWREHAAHIALATGDAAAAAPIYRALLEGDEGRNHRVRLALAEALVATGADTEAITVLGGATPHPEIRRGTQRLTAGDDIDFAPRGPREGMATLLVRMSADLSRERSVPVALAFSRIATWLDPDDASGWLLTAQLLARAEQYDGALTAAKAVGVDDPLAGYARAQEAGLLRELGREDEALTMLETAATAPGARVEDHLQLGDAYQNAERFDDAIVAYRRALETPEMAEQAGWQVHFLIGAAQEQKGDWQAAERALRRSLEIAPEEAITLNYLGYTLLDRGMKQDEAIALIEQAHELRPTDGHITDSLGWAQYRLGDYDTAVDTLEQAVSSVPDDATINDHLGDAYWQVGRRIEARFRWRAALDAEPSDEQRMEIVQKLDYGLDRVEAARELARAGVTPTS
ncbi:MAG: tetratricopeptide repeat protein, partial [Pseudomonadota bacterium]